MSKCLDEQGLRRVWGKVKSYLATMLVDFTEEQLEEICDFEEGMNEDDVIPKATKDLLGCVVVGDGLDVDANGILSNAKGMDLLWQNASPTSAFARQQLIIDMDGYDFLIVELKYAKTTDETVICFGKPAVQFLLTATAWASYANIGYSSRLMVPIDGGFQVESAYVHNMASTSSGTQNNDYLIPYKIFGIKGVS